MNCRDVRKQLTHGPGADPELVRHLSGCPECARFAERMMAVREVLRTRLSTVVPDAGFAARVTARLGAPADPFVWAARRLVPATLALTMVLAGWCLLRTPAPASLAEELADGDLFTWVETGDEERR
jgi:anti-sigma factor RsiW